MPNMRSANNFHCPASDCRELMSRIHHAEISYNPNCKSQSGQFNLQRINVDLGFCNDDTRRFVQLLWQPASIYIVTSVCSISLQAGQFVDFLPGFSSESRLPKFTRMHRAVNSHGWKFPTHARALRFAWNFPARLSVTH